MTQCQDILNDICVSVGQTANLEVATRGQAESTLWKQHRIGRIISTVAHDVKTLKENTSPVNCLKKIFKDSQKDNSGLAAIQYGLSNEPKVKTDYSNIMCEIHNNFELRDCGVVVDDTCSLFAASPDGVRTCTCHGEGLLEVKCAYIHRDETVVGAAKSDRDFYLTQDSLALKENH